VKTLTGAVDAEIDKASLRVVHLLDASFVPTLTIYLTDAPVAISWNGNEYQPSAYLRFSNVTDTAEMLINRCTVALSGVDQTIIALLMQDTYLGRRATVRKAFLTEGLQVIANPCLLMDGRFDAPVIQTDPDSGTCECQVDIVSRWSPLIRPSGRRTNDADQQALFPGDLGFDQVTKDDATIMWGGKGHFTGRDNRGSPFGG